MVKQETIRKKVDRIKEILDRIEHGSYTDMSISWVTTQIDWLYKFRYIDYDEMSKLAERATNIIKTYKPN